MKKFLYSAVSLAVVAIVLLLIVPLSPFLMDVMIILNISLAIIILLISMNIKEALEFSIFPSLLLITTLFRLALNVSSTRNILSNQGQSGQVIQSFGDFVLQGNVVIGFIIYIIIVLVQFIVITKGAERVAEVAARFTLDAMPGKQMAIDADLSSGLINEQEAKMRRNKIQKEADFYGAMDGATKIVKGDSIMSLIMTLVNFVGGILIGLVQGGMSFGEVLSVYSIATVGDGLVSQIPALLISTATGMIVTRSVSEGSLNDDVSKQFMAQPFSIMAGGVAMLVLAVVPGMPKFQMIVLGGGLLAGGWQLSKRMDELGTMAAEAEAEQLLPGEGQPVSEEEYFKDINNVYSLIGVEAIEMEFGYSLIPLVDESSGGKMINRIVIFRRQYAQEMGLVIPSIRLRDSSSLNTNQYVVKIKGEEVARGEILVDYYLALEPVNPTKEIDGIDTIEPAYGIPGKWISIDKKEMAEIYGYTVIDPLSVMLTHLSETVRKHAHELLSRQEVVQLVDNVKMNAPQLVEELFPNVISYGVFQKILVNLLREGIPIKDMETIMETIADSAMTVKDMDTITENIRTSLKRTITRKFCDGGVMRVITLSADLEKSIITSLTKGEQGMYLALSPDMMQSIIQQLGDEIRKFQELAQDPIVLTSQVVRQHFYHLIEQFYPNVYVLSFNEISNNIQIQAVGNIGA
ncbi:MAG: flagellar biosynthesis protein FlhA [Lachnospiraceae bacterium]|mgnify:CR=1 FL=1|jgi:flagellar biosynthesis protein FlhA|uniref:flagellar biosynthesis protein FlhA n=1 Tax=Candidatus Merdisoma sp. JLR.KK011 TaxID=3114299 RepID=UPI001433632E|nr:flagellar biosynthesis protein FlhA [Lachnospiraceae bacterium]MCI9253116.1 flagellar biosynthesis protein FlhA [Lachnospiraceae bacterium]MCI9477675.1 flagellar biosynthesis protein FlhA [Lachnospiraceae bacterium]MCI9622788.1 flagellar biosynthesis protein FlhA [Lachnospiraceae bacterium]GFI08156.1 flagellar biosynthesis protein FlhA [Lachnospiraceae bacterium]